ncbi:MAG: DNA ligase D [Bacteroidota bacterium]|nr:DNA ligase D [Bacteroidota bacterium]
MPKDNAVERLLAQQKKSNFPEKIIPMLATLVDKPFDSPGWMYEVKWDGYRAIAFIRNGVVELASRNSKSFNDKFYPVFQELQKWKMNMIIDGEIVSVNEKGLADFSSLQSWRSEADGELIYYVFDVLWIDGKSTMHLPLIERREILKSILPESGNIRLSENFETGGIEFFKLAEEMSLEGIMAKKADSIYDPGSRTKDWLKIKTQKRQEVVIGGFTNNEGSSKLFSSLLVGVFESDRLIYTGKIGTGFTQKLQLEMMGKFKPLIIEDCPFTQIPDVNKPSRFRPNPPKAAAVWLKPEIICEVSFREMTSDGVMRHPSFEGLREDKKPKEIFLEKEIETTKIVNEGPRLNQKNIIPAAPESSRKTLLNPTEETQVRNVNGHDLKFTNLSKIFWPAEKITKRDLINYYYQAAPFILPYLKNRPQSLNRFPNGINGKSFYQKDVTGKVPGWIKTFPYHSNIDGDKNYMIISDEASLLYLVSLGCIEINPWSSTDVKPDNPDWCIIDLDPDKNSFNQVIEAAQVTRKILDAAGVDSYCKTSGSTGLHIYIPLASKYSYEDSKEFARKIAKLVNKELPKFTSIERMVSNRNGKMYIDFLQNRPQATLAAPYSVRPKPGATVSMPLHWEEVKKGLKMKNFTLKNSISRMKSEGDIFKPVLGKGINIKAATNKLNELE